MGTPALLLALPLALLLAGCSADAAPAPAPTTADAPDTRGSLAALPGLSASLRQSRSDWAARVVQVRVDNASGIDLDVGQARLTWDGASGTATSSRGRGVHDGVAREISVPLGAPVCPGDAGPARVELDVTADDGRAATLDLDVADPQGHLARIHTEDCAEAAVEAGARLAVAEGLTVDDARAGGGTVGAARLALTLTPVAGGPRVEVTAVDGTVLMAPTSAEGAAAASATGWTPDGLATSPPAAAPVVARLAFLPARCDPHAVAEDKRGTYLGIHARVDGVDQPVFYVGVSEAVRGAIHDYIGLACGWPAAS